MPEWTLAVTVREPGHPGRQRRTGQVPAVLYGRGTPSEALAVDRHALTGLLGRGGAHHVIDLDLGEKRRPAMIKEIQWHPVDGSIVHVDFHAISLDEAIHADVPLRSAGEAEVQRRGGMIEQERHQVRVSCLPAELPEFLTVDVSAFEVGHVMTVGELVAPEGVRILDTASDIVLSVVAPRVAEEPAAAEPEAAASAEPESAARTRPEAEREG